MVYFKYKSTKLYKQPEKGEIMLTTANNTANTRISVRGHIGHQIYLSGSFVPEHVNPSEDKLFIGNGTTTQELSITHLRQLEAIDTVMITTAIGKLTIDYSSRDKPTATLNGEPLSH